MCRKWGEDMKLNDKTVAILEDIERRISPETEEDFAKQWEEFLYNRFDGEVFTPVRKELSLPRTEIPNININDAIESYELMLCSELKRVSDALGSKSLSPALRANYGTGIMSSLFGAEIFLMPRYQNTLPTTKPFNDTSKIEEMIEKGIPDLCSGFGKKVFELADHIGLLIHDENFLSRMNLP